jgi:hypothetical protein
MSTPAQIAANQLNSQLSTGPTSDPGKARSATNALKTGIHAEALFIPGESPDAFAELRDHYYITYLPAGPEQLFHLNKAIRHDWLIQRFQRLEEQIWALAASRIEAPVPHLELAQVFDQQNANLMRLHRRMAYSEKAYDRAMDAFHRLQAAQAAQAAPQPQQTTAQTPQLASFRTTPSHVPGLSSLDDLEARIRAECAARNLDFDSFAPSPDEFGPGRKEEPGV